MNFIFDPSLVLYLPLYQLDGASFVSKDAHGHLCSVTGALWRPSGRYFDGTDDKIVANTVAANSFFDAAHTLVAWVRLAGWGANITAVAGGVTALPIHYIMLSFKSDNKFWTQTNGPGGINEVVSASTYNNDTGWHFLAVTVDADGHISHFVVDGTDDGNDSTNDNDLSNLDKFYIGQVPYNVPNISVWNGDIGEVWVYGRELTLAEIQNVRLATKWRYQ